MLWGSYGLVHIASLLLSVAMITGLYFLLRKRSEKTQTIHRQAQLHVFDRSNQSRTAADVQSHSPPLLVYVRGHTFYCAVSRNRIPARDRKGDQKMQKTDKRVSNIQKINRREHLTNALGGFV